MQRTDRYCDVCNKKMTYLDDNKVLCKQGIQLANVIAITPFNPNDASLNDKQIKLEATDFCSSACLNSAVTQLLDRVQSACSTMKPLP